MQGVYYRQNTHYPWILLGKTKGVGHAEVLMRKHCKMHVTGRFIYLECKELPNTIWNLRVLCFRTISSRLAKTLEGHWKKIRKGGKMIWVKYNPKQLELTTLEKREK